MEGDPDPGDKQRPFLADLRLLRIAETLDAAAGPGFVPPPLG